MARRMPNYRRTWVLRQALTLSTKSRQSLPNSSNGSPCGMWCFRLPVLNPLDYNAPRATGVHDFEFYAPTTWAEAFSLLRMEGAQIIAGGTDLVPLLRCHEAQPQVLVDLHCLPNLRYVSHNGGSVNIGAMTTHAELATSPLCLSHSPALAKAASAIGSTQIRNRGTVGGNIASASPAGDTLPPLLVLGAVVRLASDGTERCVPLTELLTGPGETSLERGEILQSVEFPGPPEDAGSAFLKVGRRNAVAISVASVAVLLRLRANVLHDVRVAAGAVAPTAMRCSATEQSLEGRPLTEESLASAAETIHSEIQPITDLRASSNYRGLAAAALLKRAVIHAAQLSKARQEREVIE